MTTLSLIVLLLTIGALTYAVAADLVGRRSFFCYFESLSPTRHIAYASSAFLAFLALWSFVTYGHLVQPKFLPTPGATFNALVESATSGELYTNTKASLRRVAIGFGLAAAIGITLGSIAGAFPQPAAIVLPINSAIRYLPPTAFIALTILWFGIDEASKVALIMLAIVFYITQMVADTVRLVPRTFVEAAQSLGANRWEVFKRVSLAMSWPEILAALRVNLGAAWTFVVVAEFVAGQEGLGYLMALNQRFGNPPKLFAVLLTVGVLGFATDTLMALLIRWNSRWR